MGESKSAAGLPGGRAARAGQGAGVPAARSSAILETPGLSSEKVLQGVVNAIPIGLAVPRAVPGPDQVPQGRLPHARLRGDPLDPAGPAQDPRRRRPARSKSATPTTCSLSREDPFLLEEKKLIELIGNRLGRQFEEWESTIPVDGTCVAADAAARRKPDWPGHPGPASGRPTRCSTGASCGA